MSLSKNCLRRVLTLCLYCALPLVLVLPSRAQFPTAIGEGQMVPRHLAAQFVATQQDSPDGNTIYEVDFIDATEHHTPVLEIVAGTKALTQSERAKRVASRLQHLSEESPDFCQKLHVANVNSQLVVMDDASGRFIITADKKSAELSGMHSDKYATYLLDQIKQALAGKLR